MALAEAQEEAEHRVYGGVAVTGCGRRGKDGLSSLPSSCLLPIAQIIATTSLEGIQSMPTPMIQGIRYLRNAGVLTDIAAGTFTHTFKPFNLVYGFNGCGKTTLSRLIDSIGDQGLNQNLADGAEFAFTLSDGTQPSNSSPANAASRFLAVFNEDYIESSLAWKQGTAKPIIYLGKEQAELAEKLKVLESNESTAVAEEVLRASEFSSAHNALETQCRDTGRVIAEALSLGRRYNASNLRSDFAVRKYTSDDKLNDDEGQRLKEVINKSDLPSPLEAKTPPTGGNAIRDLVAKALANRVQEIAIQSLQRRKDALDWVRQGLPLHSGEHDCLFCGNELKEHRVQQLQQALRSGFDEFATQLDAAKESVEHFRVSCRRHRDSILAPAEVLPTFRSPLGAANRSVLAKLDATIQVADRWLDLLESKRANPDGLLEPEPLDGDWDVEISRLYFVVNDLVTRNNEALANFSQEQNVARERLKAHHLADSQSIYEGALALETDTRLAKDNATAALARVRTEIAAIRAQLRTHGPAATELNRLLKGYLGHDQIALQADTEGYQICRNGRPSKKPLSEGEKTAVAFCYFVTSLASEGRKIGDLIVVLDDPISSLDARAMTHVVSMVRKTFSSTNQLFILTHNLDFMREMKKWLAKRYKDQEAEFLFVETGIDPQGVRQSSMVRMPTLIREYESEYHYLYSLVKNLSETPKDTERFSYLMPNAIRKVLDIFLAFKDPGTSGLETKVDKVVQDHPSLDVARVKAMERLAQLVTGPH